MAVDPEGADGDVRSGGESVEGERSPRVLTAFKIRSEDKPKIIMFPHQSVCLSIS